MEHRITYRYVLTGDALRYGRPGTHTARKNHIRRTLKAAGADLAKVRFRRGSLNGDRVIHAYWETPSMSRYSRETTEP